MLDEQPYYLLRHWHRERWARHRTSVRDLCVQAIKVRETNRTYIKWLAGQLRLKH
jgi:hypothetical protein